MPQHGERSRLIVGGQTPPVSPAARACSLAARQPEDRADPAAGPLFRQLENSGFIRL
ncbi:hypothetical protein HMPREF1141_0535 [Clostridium sp. MSTE9]|nr:hypothetical protein HMPREF1141_0535 [Clostridium sp. MSTE9]